jgi:hypothetical protein|tara:strand:- start:1352 stop:1516 length:165 start_codon:yes stop_codon:yes gene_type:complete
MKVCDKCGNKFNCNIDDCWCFEYPNVIPIVSKSCLCEICLMDMIKKIGKNKNEK